MQVILEDFPATSIDLHYVAMFPETEVAELKRYYPDHMDHVIGQEDLGNPDVIRKKLKLPDPSNPPAIEVRLWFKAMALDSGLKGWCLN